MQLDFGVRMGPGIFCIVWPQAERARILEPSYYWKPVAIAAVAVLRCSGNAIGPRGAFYKWLGLVTWIVSLSYSNRKQPRGQNHSFYLQLQAFYIVATPTVMLQPERDMMLIIRLGAYLFIYLFIYLVCSWTHAQPNAKNPDQEESICPTLWINGRSTYKRYRLSENSRFGFEFESKLAFEFKSFVVYARSLPMISWTHMACRSNSRIGNVSGPRVISPKIMS